MRTEITLIVQDKSKSSSPGVEEGNSPRAYGTPDVWRKYRIDAGKVNQWIANLRMVNFYCRFEYSFKENFFVLNTKEFYFYLVD